MRAFTFVSELEYTAASVCGCLLNCSHCKVEPVIAGTSAAARRATCLPVITGPSHIRNSSTLFDHKTYSAAPPRRFSLSIATDASLPFYTQPRLSALLLFFSFLFLLPTFTYANFHCANISALLSLSTVNHCANIHCIVYFR